jgi:predicted SAM-dependent methyltransferase
MALVASESTVTRKRVLNAGSGPQSARRMHPAFDPALWDELRLDIDPHAKPDIVGSVVDMRLAVGSQSQDAVWCSHILEHLFSHEVPVALAEFQRVLKPDGFALITCPDLETVADLILSNGLDSEAYQSPAGPITPLDMLYGHSRSITEGRTYMAHKTGFTCARFGQLLIDAGFSTVLVKRDRFDLWALALMPTANQEQIQRDLKHAGLEMFDEGA